METLKHIQFEKSNEFGFIMLNRPEVHNAIDPLMISELTNLFTELSNDDSIRAVIIRGRGKSFSSGADLNYMQSLVGSTKRDNL